MLVLFWKHFVRHTIECRKQYGMIETTRLIQTYIVEYTD